MIRRSACVDEGGGRRGHYEDVAVEAEVVAVVELVVVEEVGFGSCRSLAAFGIVEVLAPGWVGHRIVQEGKSGDCRLVIRSHQMTALADYRCLMCGCY